MTDIGDHPLQDEETNGESNNGKKRRMTDENNDEEEEEEEEEKEEEDEDDDNYDDDEDDSNDDEEVDLMEDGHEDDNDGEEEDEVYSIDEDDDESDSEGVLPSSDEDDNDDKSVCTKIVEELSRNRPMYENIYKYRKCLPNMEYYPDGKVHLIAKAIRKNRTINIFGFRGFLFTTNGFSILIEAIVHNKSIRTLVLRGRYNGNNIFENSLIRLLANKLKVNAGSFDVLILRSSKIGWIGMVTIFESMLCNTTINLLDMSRTIEWDTPTGYPLLHYNPTLQAAISSNADPTIPTKSEVAGMVGKVLQWNKTLTILDLAFNPLGDEFIVVMADAVRSTHNTTIQKLILYAVDMTDVGVTALGSLLKYNRSLSKLDISENTFTSVGVIAIGEGLKYNKTLTKLDMSHHLFDENLTIASRPEEIDFNYLATFFTCMEYNSTLEFLDIFEPDFDYGQYTSPTIIQSIVKSFEDYNDTLYVNIQSPVFHEIRSLIRQASRGKRIAQKKGGPQRRDIYNWLLLHLSDYKM